MQPVCSAMQVIRDKNAIFLDLMKVGNRTSNKIIYHALRLLEHHSELVPDASLEKIRLFTTRLLTMLVPFSPRPNPAR